MRVRSSFLKLRRPILAAPATALALVLGVVSSAPARADLLLLAAGGGGGAGCCGNPGNNGDNGQAGPNGDKGSGVTGGAGGVGSGGGQGGTNGSADGAGGAGWLGNGGNGTALATQVPTSSVPLGGSSFPTFAGGQGSSVGFDVGNNGGGFGGGGGGSFHGGGGGGGSFIAPGFTNVVSVSGANGVANGGGGAGLGGYVTINNVNVPDTGNIYNYLVPTTGFYTILAAGAQGGSGFVGALGTGNGGYGALVGGQIFLTAGTDLEIVVGQAGLTGAFGQQWGGGGGGSFIWEVTAPGPVPGVGLAGMAALTLVMGAAKFRRARG
jgi:hypothetical protein